MSNTIFKLIKSFSFALFTIIMILAGKALLQEMGTQTLAYLSYFVGFILAWFLVFIVFFERDLKKKEEISDRGMHKT